MFVSVLSLQEDFERICYNAMKYNQKRSRIWNAASTLLRHGKKVIEPYTEQGDSMLNLSSATDDAPTSVSDDAANTAAPEVTKNEGQDIVMDAAEEGLQVAVPGTAEELGDDKSVVASHPGGALEEESVPKPDSKIAVVVVEEVTPTELGLQSSQDEEKGIAAIAGDTSQDTVKDAVAVAPDVVMDSLPIPKDERPQNKEMPVARIPVQTRSNHVKDDVKVEILESTGSEDVRPDSRDEATECSSSFGYTQSKVESDPEADGFQQNAEVESELRDGNGALSSACAEDDELAGGTERYTGRFPLQQSGDRIGLFYIAISSVQWLGFIY